MADAVEVGRIYVKVVPDLTGFATDVLEDIKSIEKRLPSVKIEVELDKTSAMQVKEEIERLAKDAEAEIKASVDKSSAAKADAILDAIARRRVANISVRISKKSIKSVGEFFAAMSGARLVGSTLGNFWDFFKEMDKQIPKLAAFGLALQGIFGIMIVATANLFGLSRSLAQIANVGYALPGLLTGIGIGLGITVIALMDINNVMPEVIDKYKSLGDVISKNFWDVALDPMREMANTLFPAIKRGVGDVATALGGFFASFSKSLQDALGPRIGGMFKNLADSITIFTGAADGIARIIAVLGSVGASYLPDLATWFKNVVNNLADFLEKAEASGDIFTWIDTGIDNLKALGGVLKGLWQVLSDIGRAAEAAGSTSLQSMADGLERIHKITSSPGFQKGLTTVFSEAHKMMSKIAEISGPGMTKMFQNMGTMAQQIFPKVGEAIGNLLATFTGIVNDPTFGAGLFLFFEGVRSATTHLKGVAPQIGQALGAIHAVMGAIARGAGPLLANVFSTLNDVIQQLAPVIGGIMLFAMQQLNLTITTLRPYIHEVAVAFGEFLKSAMPLAAAVLPSLREVLVKILSNMPGMLAAWGGLLEALTRLWNFISPVLVPALMFLIEIIQNTVMGLIDGISNVINGFITTIQGIWNAFKALFAGDWAGFWNGLKEALRGILQLIWGLIEVWWNGTVLGMFKKVLFKGLMVVWKGGFSGLLGIAKNGMGLIESAITFFKDAALKLFTGGWKAIKGVTQSIWRAIVAAVKGFFEGMSKTFSFYVNTYRTIIKTGWDAITAIFRVAKTVITGVVRGFVTAIGRFFKSLGDDMLKVMKSAWDKVSNATKNGKERVINFVKSIPDRVRGIFSNAGGLLLNAGKAIINGLIDGIRSTVGNLWGELGKITSKIPFKKGPPKKDKNLLKPAGEYIIQGLIDGIDRETKTLWNRLQDITKMIEGTQIGSPVVDGMDASYTIGNSLDSSGRGSSSVLNYYAAPGSSLGAEEDLFAALERGRSLPR